MIQKSTIAFAFLSLLVIAFSFPAGSKGAFWNKSTVFDRQERKNISKAVSGKQIDILPQHNRINVGFGRKNGREYFLLKSVSRIFFQDKILRVKIDDVDFDDDGIVLGLSHNILGSGQVKFVFDHDDLGAIDDREVVDILLNTLSDSDNRYVYCNRQSGLFHLHMCNHLPLPENTMKMEMGDAESLGYRRCGFCFERMLYLPELSFEMMPERELSDDPRYHEPILDDPKRQELLADMGREVLKKWPFRLLGYHYSFQLVDSDRIKSFAIPTGKIFMTSAMFDSLETPEELEAVLVHEIAHIERRHSLKENKLKWNNFQDWQTLEIVLKGALAGVSPISPPIGGFGAIAMGGNSNQLFTYRQEFLKEADEITALYFDKHGRDRRSLRALFKRFPTGKLGDPPLPDSDDDVYQTFMERTKRIMKTRFHFYGKEHSFLYQRRGAFPNQLDLISQSWFEEEATLFVYLSDYSLLSGKDTGFIYNLDTVETAGDSEIGNVRLIISDRAGEQEFKLLRKQTTRDLWGAHLVFQCMSYDVAQRVVKDPSKVLLALDWTFRDGTIRTQTLPFVKGRVIN